MGTKKIKTHIYMLNGLWVYRRGTNERENDRAIRFCIRMNRPIFRDRLGLHLDPAAYDRRKYYQRRLEF